VRDQAHPGDHSLPPAALQDLPLTAVALVTFGCAKNLVDSEVMAGLLGGAGFRFVEDPKAADVVILNTCGFIQPSKDEADEAILSALAPGRGGKRAKVIVAGCYVERNAKELAARYPGVDAWIGVKDFDKIVSVVRGERFRRSRRTFLYDGATPRAVSTPASWAYAKISEGCSHECAFCSIPSIKGTYRSRPSRSIVAEVERLVQDGVREIDLISQDTTFYGRDRAARSRLPHLLRELGRVRDLAWIRILYGYPEEIDDALIGALQGDKVCRYLDIPFQHADPAILRRMRRAMDARRSLRLLEKLRSEIPGIAVRTSLIVGFPGEGRTQFAALKAFVREAAFDHLGVFTYSREEGTAAYELGDPVPEEVKAGRRGEIMALQAEISARKLRTRVGRTIDVLLEGPTGEDQEILVGRAESQAPEVDGIVLVSGAGPGAPASSSLRRVEITDSGSYDLRGRLIA
jgi:ribosomal protein S12 methylthiotransferase